MKCDVGVDERFDPFRDGYSFGAYLRITDYINENLIFLELEAKDKDSAIAAIVEKMSQTNVFDDASSFLKEVKGREQLGSTGIGKGVALPHARTQHVKNIVVAFARLKKGINFQSEDKEPVKLIFLLGTPLNSVGEYLKVLAKISKIARNDKIRKSLVKAESVDEVAEILKDEDLQ
jgi:PTS system nitrogen regulatory IIA component